VVDNQSTDETVLKAKAQCPQAKIIVETEPGVVSARQAGFKNAQGELLIFLDANMVVFATSGAGKSYAIKLEILRSLMMGVDVIIIDPEMEYKHLSDAVGGTYINISLSSESKINPFDLPRPTGKDFSTEDIIRGAVITVKGLLRIMLGGITAQEDSIVDRALIETYAKKDITADADLNVVQAPIMQDLQEILEGMEGSADLVLKLQKFTEGTFSGLFNSPTNVDMKNQLVVFSVRDLEDELRPLAIYAIVNYIWNVVRSERKKRILVIDEAWWLMQHEDSAKFIYALVKRCRKYFLGVTTITQDVNDFLKSQYGQAIVTSSSLQLLMRQSPAAIDLIQKVFLLTDSEKYLLLESGIGEGIFFAGLKHAAIKVVASYTEDQIVTTNPQQLLDIEKAKKEFDAQNAV
jgi:type IV secretory pathway VirB4 component